MQLSTIFKGSRLMVATVAAVGLLAINAGSVSAEMAKPKEQFMSLGTSSVGGTWFSLGGAMASLISKQYPELNVTAEITGGTVDNLKLMGNEKLELAFATNAEAYLAANGQDPFKEKMDDFAGVVGGHGIFWHLYTLESTGIKSIRDLKGKRISLGAAGSIGSSIGETVLKAHGLEMGEDWSPEYLGHGDGPGALRDGTIDAALVISSFPTSAVVDMTSSDGENVVFLNPEPEILDELLKERPYWTKVPIPGGIYNGHPNDIPNSFGVSTILLASKKLSKEAVYAITKTILENNDTLSKSHSLGQDWSKENATRGIKGVIEFHPGAEAYLKEQGLL
jgi:TRAP transporter TAXI family solute receptor